MVPQPVVLEYRQPKQRIPGLGGLGEGVRLARQGRQPVPEHPIEPLDMHRHRLPHGGGGTDGGSSLYLQQPTTLVTVLDRLGEGEPLGHDQGRAPNPARPHGSAVGAPDSLCAGLPAMGAPSHRLPSTAGMDLRESLIHQILIPPAIGVRNDKAALPLLDHAAPSISSLRWVLWGELPILLWTKDQNSSISLARRVRDRGATLRGECLSVLGGKHKPATYALVLVAGDLLGRPKAAPAHHYQ
jgi:hypothetical protein